MVVWFIIIAAFTILVLIPFIAGLFGKREILQYYGKSYYNAMIEKETESAADSMGEINRLERINLLDQTLVQYNKLIDNLADQYLNETDEKKKAVILSKQIATLEKYNKALEKMEKLEKLE